MVRRNNFILGSAASPVKENLVHCTTELHSQRTIGLKSNKMKYLTRIARVSREARTTAALM
jgi:hypothetical protein